jgi:two-component system chemotaxis sensor kinase CheA
VTHVLDVASGGDLFEAGTGQSTAGVTLLKDRVTGVVELGSVAALPVGDPQEAEWNQIAEAVR